MKKILLFGIILFSSLSNAQVNLQLLGHLPFGATCAGVRGYTDLNNNEYALVGAGNGLSVVDVTDPTTPVLLFTVPANSSLWREIAVYDHYAYSCTEGGGGITIVDLSNLPASYTSSVYTGDGAIAGQVSSGHTIQVFDDYLYIFGTNIGQGGAIICSLTNPLNPTYVGTYNIEYIHDGYVRNDTLWAAEVYAGQFSVIDVSSKSSPNLLATQSTPGNFTHNTWLSDNSQFLFTTDEVGNAPLASYDISDIQNIQLKDTYYTNVMPAEEVHNVRVLDDYLVNPSYGSQLTIVDAQYPDNLIEIASYPTGNYLCWDADPYLPSGNIIATDVGGGLYVFAPYYVRACYLEGNVTDANSGLPINGVTVNILTTNASSSTSSAGDYKTGYPDAGTYQIEFIKAGYETKVISNVVLTSGVVQTLNVQLDPFVINGQVLENGSNNPIVSALVKVSDGITTIYTTTDASGNFTVNSISSGIYEITAAYLNYDSDCITANLINGMTVTLYLTPQIYDDFTFDFGWTVSGNAVTGIWERGEPVGTIFSTTQANPENDSGNDCSDWAFVTGNGGGSANDDDVDDGVTILTSPVVDMSTYADPYLNYERWFFEQFSSNPNANDTMFISLTNGLVTEVVETVTGPSPTNSTWVPKSYRVLDFLPTTATMQMIVSISDKPGSGNPLEGGLDHVRVTEGPVGVFENTDVNLKLFPNPVDDVLLIGGLESTLYSEKLDAEIYDVTGRLVKVMNLRSEMVDVTLLQPGLYFLRIKNQDSIIGQQKFIKN